MSQFEFILAREAQLMYRRAREFDPISGNLKRWRGSIPGRDRLKGMQFEVEVSISPEFPRQPPLVTMITPIDHPQIDPTNGNVTLRILSHWRPEYHLYQVINSIKGLFARVPPKLLDTFSSRLITPAPSSTGTLPPQTPPTRAKQKPPTPVPEMPEESPKVRDLKSQISKLENELSSLQSNLIGKTEEVARLEGQMDVYNVPRTGSDRINQILHATNDKNTQILDLQSEKIALEDLTQTLENKFEVGEINSAEYAKLYKSYQKQLFLINQKLKEINK